MKRFPIDGYHFFQHGNRVIAVTTYAGRTVRGVAVCADGDEFDFEYGKRLAAARCNYKVAKRRRARALGKVESAIQDYELAKANLNKYRQYFYDAGRAELDAGTELDSVLAEKFDDGIVNLMPKS